MFRPTILAFNLPSARLSRLRFLCLKLGVQVNDVPTEGFAQTIGALCGLADLNDAEGRRNFDDEMIVFCHMDHALVNRFLQTAKQLRFAPVALKAVLTPTNAEWSPCRLYDELKQEREAIRKGETLHD